MLDESIPIFSCICPEPEGSIIRYVYPMPLTPQNVKLFWEKARVFKTLFTKELNQDFHSFTETLLSGDVDNVTSNGLFWRVDDFVGIFYVTDITEYDANIHYTFFDRRHKGRHNLVRSMIKYGFNKYGFHRVSAAIPYHVSKKEDKDKEALNQGVFSFIKSVGLVPEGRKREAALFDGEWFDVQLFGILKQETEKWELNTNK